MCVYETDTKHCNVVLYIVTSNERRKYIDLKYNIIEDIPSIKFRKIYPDTIIAFGLYDVYMAN